MEENRVLPDKVIYYANGARVLSENSDELISNDNQMIRDSIQKYGYGTYRVILHQEWDFNLEGVSNESPLMNSPAFHARKREGSRNRIEDRMIHGTYRRYNDLSENRMMLEVLHDLNAHFPYEAIAEIRKLADNPF